MRHPEKGMVVWQDSGCGTSGEGGTSADRIPNVRHLGGMETQKGSGCETPGWKWRRWRIPGVRHPDKVGRCYEWHEG